MIITKAINDHDYDHHKSNNDHEHDHRKSNESLKNKAKSKGRLKNLPN